ESSPPFEQAPSRRGVPRRFVRALSTAGILCVVYALYALCITPFVESRSGVSSISGIVKIIQQLPVSSQINVQMAERYLAKAPWAPEASFQLHSGNAFVYAKELLQVDDSEALELKPFALIWMPDGNGEEPYAL